MKKILVAVNGSEGALRAVDYAGQQFTGLSGLQITLFHLSPGVPLNYGMTGISSEF